MSMIGKVSAVFSASTSGLTSGVTQAAASLRGLESSVNSLRGGMSGLVAIQGAQLFGSLMTGAQTAARALVDMGQAQAETIDSQSKLASRLGMTYGELSGLALAGNLAGVSLDQIASAATKADVAFVRAAEGSSSAIAAFDAIGLSVDKLNGTTAAERFDAIAEAISQLPNEAQRSEAAISLFGRAGADLLPLFAQGQAGLAAMRAEADRFGLSLANFQGQNVEAMNDAFTRAEQAISGVLATTVANLAPAIESVTNQLTEFIGTSGGENIGNTIAASLLDGARVFAGIGDSLVANFSSTFDYLSQVGAQWNAVWDIGQRVALIFSGVADLIQGAFGVAIGAISTSMQGVVFALREAAQFAGFETPGLDSALEQLSAFNTTIGEGIGQNFEGAVNSFKQAFADDAEFNRAGEAIAGPFTAAIDTAIGAMQRAQTEVDVAGRTTIDQQVNQRVTVDMSEAIRGVDSRSREGIELMFKLMRGDTGNSVTERIARAAEQTAENTRDFGIEFDEVGLAPAAGV